jgi:hypothetical protein
MTEFNDNQNSSTQNKASEEPVVLLVDDNAINLQMLHQTLEGQG